jgi:predicted flap endonuclease-1-like 5' DNA nuclease
MTALLLQTLALMAVCYVIGASLGCLLRRMFAAEVAAVPAPVTVPIDRVVTPGATRRVDPLPGYDTTKVNHFGNVLEQPGAAPNPPPPQPTPAPRPVAATPPAPRPAPAPPPPAPVGSNITQLRPAPQPAAAAPMPAPVVARPVEAESADDLLRIRGIDIGLAASLARLGVIRFDQIAGWTRPDVTRISDSLGLKGRIERENWIEQAQILAKGGETAFSRARRAPAEPAAAAPVASPAPVPAPMTQPSAGAMTAGLGAAAAAAVAAGSRLAIPTVQPAVPRPPDVADRAAFSSRVAEPVRPATNEHDLLQRISGLTPAMESVLNEAGIVRYSQIATWTRADVERFEDALRTDGRIARENWIEQAQMLARGGDTAYSREFDRRGASPDVGARAPRLDDAIRTNASGALPPPSQSFDADQVANARSLAGMRSVRSKAYAAGEVLDETTRGGVRGPRTTEPNDLKRIRGIGVLIEKKLNSLGIVSYEQIAGWSAGEIDRYSQMLDFQGRIERENWVEQARILASGGATEFSKRLDRGER